MNFSANWGKFIKGPFCFRKKKERNRRINIGVSDWVYTTIRGRAWISYRSNSSSLWKPEIDATVLWVPWTTATLCHRRTWKTSSVNYYWIPHSPFLSASEPSSLSATSKVPLLATLLFSVSLSYHFFSLLLFLTFNNCPWILALLLPYLLHVSFYQFSLLSLLFETNERSLGF